jgi:two-component system sensor kinase FixL
LQQLLLNLILNAMDAMNAPEVSRRTLTLRAKLKGEHEIAISISDTGPGIAPEIATRLFKPFVTTKPGGIGLGLPICRTIAETHGGRISAHSVAGRGATFDVFLPAGEGVERCDS